MESKIKFLGHGVHPVLIVFPLGLLFASVVFDIVFFITANFLWAEIAFWTMAGGILGGLIAAPFGWIDWFAIPKNTRAKAVGLMHGLGNVLVLILFAVSWLFRNVDYAEPGAFAYVLSFGGAGIALITGWLGGELVNRMGVGIEPGAHINSPSSLSGQSASETDRAFEKVIKSRDQAA